MSGAPAWLTTRKAAILGASLMGLCTLALAAAPLVLAFQSQQERIAAGQYRLARLHAIGASAPLWQERRNTLRRTLAASPGLLQGSSLGLAGAEMQGQLNNLVAAHEGQVRSAQILPVAEEEGFERIAVQADFGLPMRRLAELLQAVESHSPYFFITSLAISGPRDWPDVSVRPALPAGPGPRAAQQEPRLEIRWTVHGYRADAS
jgi:hypothetical protein